MRRALSIAAAVNPHPNPRVGAVVLDSVGRRIGEGFHRGPGQPHAEIAALPGSGTEGATVVVNLEPCNHHGRTPPCTEALVAAGVARVVVAATDPDPRVSGRGLARLRQAGIEVIEGVLTADAEGMDPAYFHHRRTGRPLVVIKVALTLDGQTAATDGTSQWITGPLARADAHRLRASSDAVVIGAGTLISDDPRLDVRLPQYDGPQPRPVVISGHRPLPPDSRLWQRHPLVITIAGQEIPDGAEVVAVAADAGGRPDLDAAVDALSERGLLYLLLEGGSTLSHLMWSRQLIDRGIFYLGGMLAGGVGRPVFDAPWTTLGGARPIEIVDVVRLGPDLRVEWLPAPQPS